MSILQGELNLVKRLTLALVTAFIVTGACLILQDNKETSQYETIHIENKTYEIQYDSVGDVIYMKEKLND